MTPETVLRKLDEIGGDVLGAELVHHLGNDALYDAFELAEQGLVEARTYFTLTAEGRERIEGEAA